MVHLVNIKAVLPKSTQMRLNTFEGVYGKNIKIKMELSSLSYKQRIDRSYHRRFKSISSLIGAELSQSDLVFNHRGLSIFGPRFKFLPNRTKV